LKATQHPFSFHNTNLGGDFIADPESEGWRTTPRAASDGADAIVAKLVEELPKLEVPRGRIPLPMPISASSQPNRHRSPRFGR
jgi:hypothetical protein